MTSLQRPPKAQQSSRVLLRLLVLLLLVLAVGVAVWTAVTNQRIELVEDVSPADLGLDAPAIVGNLTLNVAEEPGGLVPVVLLHDADIAGSVTWDPLVDLLRHSRYKVVRIDLPGFGLSSRIPEEGPEHTVASMAEVVGTIVEDRFELPAVVAGVGLGGEVAAELAVTKPDLVKGLVMVDVDFYKEDGWEERGMKLPWIGRALAHTLRTGGTLSVDRWAPNCEEGGWCPTSEQASARRLAASVDDTTDSVLAFLGTPASSLVPSDLGLITQPVVYIWSTEGAVPEASIERVIDKLPDAVITEVPVWEVHLERPSDVFAAIEAVAR